MADPGTVYDADHDTNGQNDLSDDGRVGHDDTENVSGEPPKKRRRVTKPNPDKKFECKHEGCGKSYSRAEHLYRHQLNRELSGTLSLSLF